jgi:hypothetical protein
MIDEEREEIRLYASHRQFYIQDSDPAGSTADPDFWTDQADEDRLAMANGILGVRTGSYDFVRVRVQEHVTIPLLDLMRWDHVTEAGLMVRTRFLLIEGCLSSSGLFYRVSPGHYRVRCCHANLAASVDSTGNAGDWYLVQFWSAALSERKVLKRWSRSR